MLRLAALALLLAVPASAQVLRDDLWVTNGGVFSSTVVGNTLYLGGSFSRVGPATGGLVPVGVVSGKPTLAPLNVDGAVNAIIGDGAGGWYVGGSFRNINGVARMSVARISSTGEVKPWNAGVSGAVNTMLLSGGKLYLGGTFAAAGGQPRGNLAVVDTVTGAAFAWNPDASSSVNAMSMGAAGLLFVGGNFTTIAGVARSRAAAVDINTGVASPWQPNPDGPVYAIYANYDVINLTTYVYMGGSFSNVSGFPRANFAHVDATPGSATYNQPTGFNPSPNSAVRALVVAGRTVITTYMGGDFTVIAGQPRQRLAAFSGTNLGSWNPGADNTVVSLRLSGSTMYVGGYFGTLGGQPRPFGGAVATSGGAATAWNPEPNEPVRVFATADTTVWIGGDLTSVGGVARANLAALDLGSGQATAWNPGANGTVYALEQIGGLLYVGGAFTTVAGQSRPHIAQLDTQGGIGLWNPAPNGDVRAIAGRFNINGSTIFMGGTFTHVMNTPRNRLAAVTDDPLSPSLTSFNPDANDRVDAIKVDPSWVYVAGQFTGFAGLYSRQYVAQLDPNGIPTGFFPGSSKPIRALALVGPKLYLGFQGEGILGNQVRHGAAVFLPPTNTPLTWDPQVVGTVSAILPSGNTLYLGGYFSKVGGEFREGLAQVDTAQAAGVRPFNAPIWSFQTIAILGAEGPGVFDLAESNGKLYANGFFESILSKPHSSVAGMFVSTVDVPSAPAALLAMRAAPNPSGGSQVLSFTLAERGPARVELYNVAGRLVRTLGSGELMDPGEHRLTWDGLDSAGRRVGAGLYFARLGASTTKLMRVE